LEIKYYFIDFHSEHYELNAHFLFDFSVELPKNSSFDYFMILILFDLGSYNFIFNFENQEYF
jgi:hypothetical protein